MREEITIDLGFVEDQFSMARMRLKEAVKELNKMPHFANTTGAIKEVIGDLDIAQDLIEETRKALEAIKEE